MFERADFKVIILIMLMAIILAVTAALAYFYLINRPEYPEGTYETVIEGETIIVESDPQQAVKIISSPAAQQPVAPEISSPPEGTGGSEAEQIATVVPITPTAVVVTPLTVIPVTPLPATVVPPTAVPPTAAPPQPNQHTFIDYQVVQGDTLWSVAGKHNTTIELMARYGIDATDIVPGTLIRLAVANPAYCPGTFPYVIRKGDTLSSIARKCNTTVENLLQINGIGPGFRLDATNVLCVPNPP